MKSEQLKEAIRIAKEEDVCSVSGKNYKAIETIVNFVQSHLSAASKELPERMKEMPPPGDPYGLYNNGFNACRDQVIPILAKKNEEIATLKLLISDLNSRLDLLESKNDTLQSSLTASEQRVKELENDLLGANNRIMLFTKTDNQEIVTLRNRIASLEDALKRADGIPSERAIESTIHTFCINNGIFFKNFDMVEHLAQAIHALITTRKVE